MRDAVVYDGCAYPFSTSLAIKNLEYLPSAKTLNSPFNSLAIMRLCSIVEYLIAVWMTRTESCLKTKSLTLPVMISNSSLTSPFLSSLSTCDFSLSFSQSFLDRSMMSAFGFAAFRSLARAFCFACASRELVAGRIVSRKPWNRQTAGTYS